MITIGLACLAVFLVFSMCYSLRRSAVYNRGGDPGPAILQSVRRPDLFTRHHDGPRDQAAVELAGRQNLQPYQGKQRGEVRSAA